MLLDTKFVIKFKVLTKELVLCQKHKKGLFFIELNQGKLKVGPFLLTLVNCSFKIKPQFVA